MVLNNKLFITFNREANGSHLFEISDQFLAFKVDFVDLLEYYLKVVLRFKSIRLPFLIVISITHVDIKGYLLKLDIVKVVHLQLIEDTEGETFLHRLTEVRIELEQALHHLLHLWVGFDGIYLF